MYFAFVKKSDLIKYLCVFFSLVILLNLTYFTNAYYVFNARAIKKLPIYSVETTEKKVAISFDCAWGVDYTDKLLEIMANHNVKCTFFMVEFWVKKYPDYVKKIDSFSHEIGTHSSSHPYMSKLSKENIEKELISSSNAITSITGKKVVTFRPPYGDYNDLLIETASSLGLYTIQWDVDSLDWKDLSATEITNRVVKRVKNGSIVLFHNQGKHTHEALNDIIIALRSNGYTFVTIEQLIYKDNYYLTPEGRQVKNV